MFGIVIAGCAAGTPGGFSKGDRWTFPLVGPLEDGLLIVPASVHGHGPYLLVIDPDSSLSAIDKQVADEAGLQMGAGPGRIDEAGAEQARGYAELVDVKLGDLAIARRQVMLVPSGFYDTDGRRVHGVIGRDVLGDALVFGFDRDQGIATLSTAKVFTPPPNAIAIGYRKVEVEAAMVRTTGTGFAAESTDRDASSRIGVTTRAEGPRLEVTPVARRVATASIGDFKGAMHLDLGAPVSQLRESLWTKAKLAPTEVKVRLVDEAASTRVVTSAGLAAVAVGAAKSPHVTLVPYVDKRFGLDQVDGALGLDFFQPYAVYVNWDAATYFLKPRGELAATLTARLGRWGADIPACAHPGCVTVTLAKVDAGTRLDVVRDPEAANRVLELSLAATSAAGAAMEPLIVELPKSTDKISGAVPVLYEGATLTVRDVSPFGRPCSGDGGCVFFLHTPSDAR